MYEVIVNGQDEYEFEQAAKDVDFSLEDERWWQDIKRLRQSDFMNASQGFAQATDLLKAVGQWPTASFQHGRRDNRPSRFAALQKMLRQVKSRASVGDAKDMNDFSVVCDQRLSTSSLHRENSNFGTAISDGDEADDEAAMTESEVGVVGNNFDKYDLDASEDESDLSDIERPQSLRRAKTAPSRSGIPFLSKKLDLRKAIWKDSSRDAPPKGKRPTSQSVAPLKPHPNAAASDMATLQNRKHGGIARSTASSMSEVSASQISSSSQAPPHIPFGESLPKFTSKPVPRTAVAQEEVAGPSIMFVDTPAAVRHQDPLAAALPPDSSTPAASQFTSSLQHSPILSPSVSTQPTASPASGYPASGYPAQRSVPVSFNDLPCRAQHLILNELIRGQSEDTAVVFTTLPSPMEGTCKSERESVKYVSDLEVLTEGLGPVLLVSGGSMTVTMNL